MKQGRPKKIKDSDQLWQLWEEFRKWIKENPLIYQETITGPKGTTVKTITHSRPMTWQGFDAWLGRNKNINGIEQYRTDRGGAYAEFQNVISRIRDEMYADKFAGAACGLYNASIIARELGLMDRKQEEKKPEKKLTREEIEKRLRELLGSSK